MRGCHDAIQQLAGCFADGIEFIGRAAGLSEMAEGEIPSKAALARGDVFEISQNRCRYFSRCQQSRRLRGWIKGGRPGVDPLSQHG